MRAIIVLAAIVLLLALVGWVTFSNGPDRATINIEKEKARQDTQQAIEKTEDAIETGRQNLNDGFSGDEQVDPEEQNTEATPSETPVPSGAPVEREPADVQ